MVTNVASWKITPDTKVSFCRFISGMPLKMNHIQKCTVYIMERTQKWRWGVLSILLGILSFYNNPLTSIPYLHLTCKKWSRKIWFVCSTNKSILMQHRSYTFFLWHISLLFSEAGLLIILSRIHISVVKPAFSKYPSTRCGKVKLPWLREITAVGDRDCRDCGLWSPYHGHHVHLVLQEESTGYPQEQTSPSTYPV